MMQLINGLFDLLRPLVPSLPGGGDDTLRYPTQSVFVWNELFQDPNNAFIRQQQGRLF
jgi:hypothetical protein